MSKGFKEYLKEASYFTRRLKRGGPIGAEFDEPDEEYYRQREKNKIRLLGISKKDGKGVTTLFVQLPNVRSIKTVPKFSDTIFTLANGTNWEDLKHIFEKEVDLKSSTLLKIKKEIDKKAAKHGNTLSGTLSKEDVTFKMKLPLLAMLNKNHLKFMVKY